MRLVRRALVCERVGTRKRVFERALRQGREVAIALAAVLASGTGDAAPATVSPRSVRVVNRPEARPLLSESAPLVTARARGWAEALTAVDVKNRNTNAHASLRLYADDGGIDRVALRAFMRVACGNANAADDESGEVAEPLAPRLVQLAFRAAYHFKATSIVIVSATRAGTHGKHGAGEALDFKLDGVAASALAAYARGFPRAGVGVYTNPKTQYVHVDVRERSYHWLDASPPGITWRESLLKDSSQAARDLSYAPALDLPESSGR